MEAKKLNEKFPTLVLVVWNMGDIVTCFNDPVHGSTIKAASSLKT
jgi:3-deoxy-D-arabino-heptulosonate 7-phosphate (DAHP) synthase class II